MSRRWMIAAMTWCASVGAVLTALLYAYQALWVLTTADEPYYKCSNKRFDSFEGHGEPAFTGLASGYLHPHALCQWADGFELSMIPQGVTETYYVLLAATCVTAVVALAGTAMRRIKARQTALR